MDLGSHLALAQAAPLPFDVSSLTTMGPLGVIVVYLLWYIGKLQDKMDKLIEAHKAEIAAERSLNAQLQSERLADQKTLIPLAQSMTAATEQTLGVIGRMANK